MKRWIGILLGILVLVGLAIGVYQFRDHPKAVNGAVNFEVDRIGGGKIKSDDYKGKVIILDFWATWCPPCVASTADLNALAKEYKDKDMVIIGLSMDRDLSAVPTFMTAHAIRYPIGLASNKEISLVGGVSAIPTLVILDREHRIITKLLGYQDPSALKALVDPLL